MSKNLYLLIVLAFSLACKNPKVQTEPDKTEPDKTEQTKERVRENTPVEQVVFPDSENPALTLSKLEGALMYDWSEFEDFAISNNFAFDEYKDESGQTSKAYKKSNTGLVKVVENRADDYLTKVWYMFKSQADYTYYKKQLIAYGYQFIEQKGGGEGRISLVTMRYLKDPISAELVSMKYGEDLEYWLVLMGKRRY